MMFGHYPTDILLSLSIFVISLWMLVIFRTNIILMVFSLELLLLANILGFTISSIYLNDIIGEIFSLFILVMAAIETAIGLCLILSYYRITNTNLSPNLNIEVFLSAAFLVNGEPISTIAGMKELFYIIMIIIASIQPMKAIYGARANVVRYLHGVKHDHELWEFENLMAYFRPNQSYWQDVLPRDVLAWYRSTKFDPLPQYQHWVDYLDVLEERARRRYFFYWTVLTFEWLPQRNERLFQQTVRVYGNTDLEDKHFSLARFPHYLDFVYLTRVAPYTLVGKRILERRAYDFQAQNIIKDYKIEIEQQKAEIERLNDVIKMKDAYIEMYSRPQ